MAKSTSVLMLAMALSPGQVAGAEEPAHEASCDGNTCKVEFPPIPDAASGIVVEDPFAPASAGAASGGAPSAGAASGGPRAVPAIDLDPRHVPPPATAALPAGRGVRSSTWLTVAGVSVATVVASALLLHRLDVGRGGAHERENGGDLEGIAVVRWAGR